MIQRIQSVYLFLTTIIAILFLTGTIIIFSEGINSLGLKLTGIYRLAESGHERIENLPVLTFLLPVIPLISFIAIFLFKNRKVQMMVTILLILLICVQIGLLAFYSFEIISTKDAQIIPGPKLIIPVAELTLAILTYRGIKKDEELVKSYDRLR